MYPGYNDESIFLLIDHEEKLEPKNQIGISDATVSWTSKKTIIKQRIILFILVKVH